MVAGINVIDYATLTVSSAVVTLVSDASPTLPAGANRAYFTVETAGIRWRGDGTDPDANEGHLLSSGDSLSLTGSNYRQLLENIKFIADSTDGALKVTYFD